MWVRGGEGVQFCSVNVGVGVVGVMDVGVCILLQALLNCSQVAVAAPADAFQWLCWLQDLHSLLSVSS
jgi:hypothetical protein